MKRAILNGVTQVWARWSAKGGTRGWGWRSAMMLGLAICTLFAAPSGAKAEEFAIAASSGDLYAVDASTQQVRRLSRTPQMFDIALDSKGQMIGVTGQGEVFRIRPRTGESRQIGWTRTFVNGLVFDATDTLLGSGGGAIYEISTDDGRAAEVQRIRGFASSGDLAQAPDGTIYATSGGGNSDVLFRIDPQSFRAQAVGRIGVRDVYCLVWSNAAQSLIGVTRRNQMMIIDTQSGLGIPLGTLNLSGDCFGASRLQQGDQPISMAAPVRGSRG